MALIDKLKAIADGFRSARGTADPLTLDEMAVLASEPAGMDEAELDGILSAVDELNGSENVAIPLPIFQALAVGIIPDAPKGFATSQFTLNMISTATGELQEG